LNALNKYYESTINYPVVFTNLPDGLFIANTPPKSLELMVEAHGFTLLRQKMNLDFTPIELDVERMLINAEKLENRAYRIQTATFIARISDQLSSEIKVIEIRPLSLILELDGLGSKEVKVVPDLELDFTPQYNLTSEVKTEPSFVKVTAPVAILDTLKAIRTQKHKLSKIEKDITVSLPLQVTGNLQCEPLQVLVTIPVEEFTEKVVPVGVKITGQPEGISIKLFPSEVQVSFKVGLKNYSSITPDNFEITIPYSELTVSSLNAAVRLTRQPDFIYDIKCSPPTVEFLIEK
jgi:hypothetical protein